MSQKKLPENQVPEVMHFLEVQEKVQRIKEAYPEVFEQFSQLAEEYNAALEAADKTVRAQKVSCGPFVMYQTQTRYNAEKLYEEVGRDRFLEMGGSVKTVTTFDVDRAKLEAHIAAGVLPADVVDEVRDVSPRYKKPEKIILG